MTKSSLKVNNRMFTFAEMNNKFNNLYKKQNLATNHVRLCSGFINKNCSVYDFGFYFAYPNAALGWILLHKINV